MKTAATSILATLLLALVLGGSQAFARTAAAPPTLLVQAIGAGTVTGTGISCGGGLLTCANTYADTTAVTLTAVAATGWSFSHWEDDATCTGSTATTCAATPSTGGDTATAVFSQTGGGTLPFQTFAVSLSSQDGAVVNGSTNYGIACGNTGATPPATACSVSAPQGSTLTVRAQPSPGDLFNGWGGSCGGTSTTCSVYLSADQNVSADFVSGATKTLSITVTGSGAVTGGGISCASGTTCTQQEPPTATITLTATPSSGYAFTGWSGGCSGLQTTCTVEMSSVATEVSVTANFAQLVPVLITVNGAGTVTGANVTCGPGPTTCSGSAAPSSTIQLQAKPTVAGTSVSWTGCSSAASTICNVTVGSAPISVTVTFSGGFGGGSTFAVTGTVTGDGYLTATRGATLYCTSAGGSGCTATVQQNTPVTLQAVPVSGDAADFNGWSGSAASTCDDTSLTCTIVVTSASSVEADFNGPFTTYDLTASISGSGTVSGAGLRCAFTGSASCTSPQATGASVTLTAAPSPGSLFTGWSGGCTGTSATCTLIMTADKNVTATFATAPPGREPLTVAVTGAGTVAYTGGSCKSTGTSKTCETTARENTSVTLTATPAAGYAFSKWGGSCTSKTATCTVRMSGPQSVQVTFVRLALAPGRKPKITELTTGFRVTLSFIAGEAGLLTVTTKPNVAHLTKTVKAGAGTAPVAVKKHGRYVFTLSLHSKSGTHAIRYTVKV